MGSFLAVGNALLTIRDRRLFREQYRSFNEYCNVRWGMGKNYANRLISGSQVAANLSAHADNFSPLVKILPTSEYQVRPLTRLEPDQQREAWNKANETAPNGKVTSKHIANTVKELTAPAPEPNPPSASHSGFAYSGPPRRAPFTPPSPPPSMGCLLCGPWRGW